MAVLLLEGEKGGSSLPAPALYPGVACPAKAPWLLGAYDDHVAKAGMKPAPYEK